MIDDFTESHQGPNMELPEGQLRNLIESLTGPSSQDERRAKRRTAVVTRATLRIMDGASKRTFSVLTRDVSASGIGLITAAPVERGVHVLLELPHAGGTPLAVEGEIRYCRAIADGMWGVGVQFSITPKPSNP
jgi:hypothetical protein